MTELEDKLVKGINKTMTGIAVYINDKVPDMKY